MDRNPTYEENSLAFFVGESTSGERGEMRIKEKIKIKGYAHNGAY